MSNHSVQWQVGDTILDLYRVIGVLSQGEFGRVYRARHLGWNVDLAIYHPSANAIAAGGVDGFRRRVDDWVRLGLHPHLASAYYLRTVNEQPLVFAEFGSGGTLHQWIHSQQLYEQGAPLRRILDIAIQIAWGLQTVHEQGLVHQNLSPTAVLVMRDGTAKLTQVGLFEPLPGYQAPEQQQASLTPQTDLWGWGLTVLEMFTGKAVEAQTEFSQAESLQAVQLLDRYLEGITPTIPRMPAPIAKLLRRCFQSNPAARPASLREVADRLQNIYQTVTGSPYRRQEPAGLLYADGLNNRALALLDLGQDTPALQLWDEALALQPQHLNSLYNRGMTLWRSGRISDRDLLTQIEAAAPESPQGRHLLGLVHLERGDCETALRFLAGSGADEVLSPLLAQLQENRTRSKRLLPEFSDRVTDLLRSANHRVSSLTLSPGGLFAVSGGSDQTVRVWSIPRQSCVCTFREHREPVTAVALNADGSQLASGSGDQTIKLWNIASSSYQFTFGSSESNSVWDKLLRRFRRSQPARSSSDHRGTVRAIAFSKDRRYLLSAADDSALKLWDVGSGKCLQTFRGHRSRVFAVAFDPSGREAISASDDQTIKRWNLKTGQVVQSFEGHRQLTSAVLSSSGRYLLAGDTPIKLWNLATAQVMRTFDAPGVQAVAFSPDEQFMLSGSSDGQLRLWELESGRCLRSFEPHESSIVAVAVSADGRYALSSDRSSLKLWAVHFDAPIDRAPLMLSQLSTPVAGLTGNRRYEEEIAQAQAALDRGDAVAAAQHLRLARSQPGYQQGIEAVQAWLNLYPHLPHQTLRESWERATLDQHSAGVRAIAFRADGQSLLSCSADRTLKVWDKATERCLLSFEGHQDSIEAVTLSPDGKQALSGSGDCSVKLWDLQTGEALRTLTGHQDKVNTVAFHPRGRFALSGSDDRTVKLWDTATGRCLRTLTQHSDRVTSLAVSADGRSLLSSGADKTAVLWDLATGEVLRVLEGHRAIVSAVAIALDGRFALSGSGDHTIRLWNLATGDCVKTLSGHIESVNAVAFSPDGRFAASGSGDRTIRLWNLATGDCVKTLSGHMESVNAVAFSPDSRFVASGSDDCTIKLWLLDWELGDFAGRELPADWDEGASPYLDIFLTLHSPLRAPLPDLRDPSSTAITQALTPAGTPVWSEADLSQLMRQLQQVGYGWLDAAAVREQLFSRSRAVAQAVLPAGGTSAFATAYATEFATAFGTEISGAEAAAQVVLTVTEGTLKGQEFVFRDRTVCIIGRAKDCHLPLPNDENHKTVSRYHCLLDIDPPGVTIRDLGSLHGTFVNGEIIGRRSPDQSPEEGMQIRSSGRDLQNGDEVKLGKTVFQLRLEGGDRASAENQTGFDETVLGQSAGKPIKQEAADRRSALNGAASERAMDSSGTLPEVAAYRLLLRLDFPADRASTRISSYAAQRQQTRESVTLKFFKPEKSIPSAAIEAFVRSLNPLKSLRHPNLLALQDVGIANDGFFFAFDAFKGESTANRVQKQGTFAVAEAIETVLQALEGLAYAHQAELVWDPMSGSAQCLIHGYLTPDNLLLTREGVKIADYGIAAAIAHARLGDVFYANAAAFMPRQRAMEFRAVQPELDVWAIAACLYYMLTGAFPRDFDGRDPYLVLLQTSPVPIRQRRGDIPLAVAELIDLALVDNPTIHFQNAAAFKQAIASISVR